MSKPKTNKDLVPVKVKRHKDNQGNHNHAILEDIDDKHVSVDLTTRKKKGYSKKSGNNYPLHKDPLDVGQKGYKPKKSYMRRQGIVDDKLNYFDEKRGTMTKEDFAQAKIYGDRAKQKYLENKKK